MIYSKECMINIASNSGNDNNRDNNNRSSFC